MFPPPITIPTSTPISMMSRTSCAICCSVFGEIPYLPSPISASPLSFRRMRLNRGGLEVEAVTGRGSYLPARRWSRSGGGPRNQQSGEDRPTPREEASGAADLRPHGSGGRDGGRGEDAALLPIDQLVEVMDRVAVDQVGARERAAGQQARCADRPRPRDGDGARLDAEILERAGRPPERAPV